jgi:isoleucyl-tRNA synthetase
MAFKEVDPRMNLPKMEEEVLKFWEEKKIFEKSVEKNPEDKSFIFYEGPPTANGRPGLHHVLARAFKDIIPRYKTMKGYRVERKAGWDTHGLPVELQVEKALGLKNKQEIENIVPGDPRQSVIEFNKKCKESVWEYKDLWEKMTRRMGYWVDMKDPYVTYKNEYIESVWWVITQIFKTKNKKGESLIYKGHKVVPYCYRCGTALSSHEVAQGYQVVKDDSVFVKFKVKAGQKIGNSNFVTDDQTYFLIWTTTPWTLPGNVALAVNKHIDYILIDADKQASELKGKYILADAGNIVGPIFEEKINKKDPTKPFQRDELFKGEELLNLEYEPLYETNNTDKKAYRVVSGDFVTTQEGTGIVHIAPAFGEDDNRVGKENDLPTLITVDLEGKISADVPGKGIPVKKKNEKNKYAVDDLIIEDLEKRGLLFKQELYEHDYPFCWRCDTPLIYYAKPSWFIRMSELSEKLVKNNENINWVPEHIKEGRFGEWLSSVKDWAISRERYWGTPLPIWECEKCGQTESIESIIELEKLSGRKFDDLHKPFIDDARWKCSCGGEMKRTPEVMDVWFDSGSMPLAQWHYPANASEEIRKKIEMGKYFPADYISEAIDQTRGWFYTLHAIATLLNESGKIPTGYAFKNVICLGHILDAKGKKMSKSRGNVIEPMEMMDEFGADMLRWMLYTINQPGLPKRFDVKSMRDIMNRVFRMLWNSYCFFVMYANIDKFQPAEEMLSPVPEIAFQKRNLLDRWIISELQILIKEVDDKLDNYDAYSSAKSIEKFIDHLSNWYIRRSRRRFWKGESDADKKEAYETLHYVLVTLAKLMAPFTPFIAEEIYKNLTGGVETQNFASVHLADFPVVDEKLIDEKLNEEMVKVREIITEGLQLRAKAKIKVRQPLEKFSIFNFRLENVELMEIVKDELNVKKISITEEILGGESWVVGEIGEIRVGLNIEITEGLKLEGATREIIRHIQEMRKEAGYQVDNRIKIGYSGWSEVFERFGELISKETLADSVDSDKIESADLQKEFIIEGRSIKLFVKK